MHGMPRGYTSSLIPPHLNGIVCRLYHSSYPNLILRRYMSSVVGFPPNLGLHEFPVTFVGFSAQLESF